MLSIANQTKLHSKVEILKSSTVRSDKMMYASDIEIIKAPLLSFNVVSSYTLLEVSCPSKTHTSGNGQSVQVIGKFVARDVLQSFSVGTR